MLFEELEVFHNQTPLFLKLLRLRPNVCRNPKLLFVSDYSDLTLSVTPSRDSAYHLTSLCSTAIADIHLSSTVVSEAVIVACLF